MDRKYGLASFTSMRFNPPASLAVISIVPAPSTRTSPVSRCAP